MQKHYFAMVSHPMTVEFNLGKEGREDTGRINGWNVPMWFKDSWNWVCYGKVRSL